MLSAVREIGKIFLSKKGEASLRPIEGTVLAIEIDGEKGFFKGIDLEDFDTKKIDKYLYKEGASKGNRPAPFAPLTDSKKTFNKIKTWVKNCYDNMKDDLISNIFKALQQDERIINALKEKIKDLPKKKSKFLTLKLNNGFLGDYPLFVKAIHIFETLRVKKSSASGNVCSVCGEVKEVSGKIDVFKFYTIDKPGFIIGGFKEEFAWKNFPVCGDCKLLLEKGKQFIESKLRFNFYGLNYYIIPKLLIGGEGILEEIIEILSDTKKTIALKERTKKRLTSDENEILEYLSEKEDILTLNFLFLQKQQSAERILLLIEDVFPSRIRKIFDAKDYVDTLFSEDYNFGRIRAFFSKSDEDKRTYDLDKYFLEIVDRVFKGRPIDFTFLVKFFMLRIRKEFVKDGYFLPRVKDALMNITFFERLGLITFKEVSMEQSLFEEIFQKYGKVLNTPEKRGIFLLGVLTQLLLNVQYSKRGSTPFTKKLKSLKMDEKDIKAILPKVQNKLEEYDSFDKGKRLIAQEASRYLLSSENWKIPVDEINFYFACGMNLNDEIAEVSYKKIKEV